MKVFFLAALLLVAAFAVQDPAMATMEKMEKSKTGRRMMDTIQIQLASGDPADDLILMLQDEEDKIDAEQDADDEWIMALQNQCVDDLAKLVDEIAATRQRIQELEDLIAALTPIKEAKEEERANLENFKALLIEKIAEIEAAKEEKDAEWAEEAEQHDSQTAVIQHVKEIIQSGFSAAFLQSKAQLVPQVLTQVAQHLNKARKQHFKRKGIQSIFKIMAGIAASQEIQAEESALARIIDLCDEILDKIAESRAIEKADYDHWCAEYEATHSQLSATLADTIARIEQLTIEINVLAKRIHNAQTELAEQEERLLQKIAQHDERESFCDNAATTYAQNREARSDQREIVSDAIGLLTSKIRLLKSYVSDRVVNLEKPIF